MPEYRFKRGLEQVRELVSLRKSEAEGRKSFHNNEAARTRGRKHEEHLCDGYCADKVAGALAEIIREIDLHLPAGQGKIPMEEE